MERAEPPAHHVPDGEVEVVLALAEIDPLVDGKVRIGRAAKSGFVLCEAMRSPGCDRQRIVDGVGNGSGERSARMLQILPESAGIVP